MGDTIRVRDHSVPCEHGSLWAHWVKAREARWWHEPDCLGGREMILERVAADQWREVAADGSSDERPSNGPT